MLAPVSPSGRPPVEKEARSCVVRARITPALMEGVRRLAAQDGQTESEFLRRVIADEVRRRQAKPKR